MQQQSGVTRREFLVQAGALAGGAMGAASVQPLTSLPELVSLNAVELSEKIRSKQVSCAEVMQTYLAHIERYNPKVNAIVSLQPHDALLQQAQERDAQLARGETLGWMHGFPLAVKDLALTKAAPWSKQHLPPLLQSAS